MAWQLVDEVMKREDLGMANKITLLLIADAVNKKDAYTWRSLDFLAKRAGASKRTIIRSVQELERRGLLKIQKGKGRHHANRYQVLLTTNSVTQSPFNARKGDRESRKGDTVSHSPSYYLKERKKSHFFSPGRTRKPVKVAL
ncbi:helix-turn-helix domain-containing protein [Nitrospira sp. M1]